MISRGIIVWTMLAIVAGVGLFQVSYRVAALEEDLERTNRQVLQERETLHVLRAEWSHLTAPSRLADLARRHLSLTPLTAGQMTGIADLPLRLPPVAGETATGESVTAIEPAIETSATAQAAAVANDQPAAIDQAEPKDVPADLPEAEAEDAAAPRTITDLIEQLATQP